MKKTEITKVIGLQYKKDKGLPRVIVKGSGRHAEEIVKNSKKSTTLPVVKNKKLVDELYKLPVDAEIGADLFGLVAALLVHVYSVENKYKNNNQEEM